LSFCPDEARCLRGAHCVESYISFTIADSNELMLMLDLESDRALDPLKLFRRFWSSPRC